MGTPPELKRYLYTRGYEDSFDARHPKLIEALPRLIELIRQATRRELPTPGMSDKVIAVMGLVTVRAFHDVLLNARQGAGIAATQLIRGMFERTVTLLHLDANPNDARRFLDYGKIQLHKHAVLVRERLGGGETDAERTLRQARMEVESQFKEPRCDVPGCKPTLHHSWTKKTPHEMAMTHGLEVHLPAAYSEPTLQIHATLQSLLGTARDIPQGIGVVMTGGQVQEADTAIAAAHHLVLAALSVLITRFGLTDLQPEIDRCGEDFLRVWRKPTQGPPTNETDAPIG